MTQHDTFHFTCRHESTRSHSKFNFFSTWNQSKDVSRPARITNMIMTHRQKLLTFSATLNYLPTWVLRQDPCNLSKFAWVSERPLKYSIECMGIGRFWFETTTVERGLHWLHFDLTRPLLVGFLKGPVQFIEKKGYPILCHSIWERWCTNI